MSSFGNSLTEYSPQMESFEFDEFESEEETSVFSEDEVMQLAAELLEVADEEELEQFLGSLIKRAGRAVRKVVKSPIGRAIGGVLKKVAKKALPIAGGALGAWVGGPLGAKIGSGLASAAGKAFGLELEGLSDEEQEFEAAKQFVRFAGATVKSAAAAPQHASPRVVANIAAAKAARQFAPGLAPRQSRSFSSGRRTGRWIRRGGTILVYGV